MQKDNAAAIAIYSRKSKFTGKGESIGNQVELCREYIRNHEGEAGLNNVVVFEDEGFSGGNLNRPGFKKMLDAARAHQLRAIIVYRLDRISRNISDFSNLIEELDHLGIDFISIREQFDTSSPMGRAMMYIASVFSQLERETIAERIRDNMHELSKTGRWLGGTTPTGYASKSVEAININGRAKKTCQLTLIPDEASIVRLIYQIFSEKDSLTATEAELLKQGVKTKNGRSFTRFAIKAILRNPVYAQADENIYNYFVSNNAELFSDESAFDGVHGIMAYNRTYQQKGKATVVRPIHEWIVSVGQHPGIISGKTWVDIQASLDRNKSLAYRKPRSNEALLTGLLYCACGNRMHPKLTKRKTSDGALIYTYVCSLKEHSKRQLCNLRNANGNLLDAAVIEQLKLLQDDRSFFSSQLKKVKELYTGSCNDYEKRIAALQKERSDCESKMNSLIDSLADMTSSASRAQVSKRIDRLDANIQEIDERIQELKVLTSQNVLTDSEFDVLRQLLSMFTSSVDEMSIQQKRTAARSLIRKVIWDGTNAHIILFGCSDDDIELPQIPNFEKESASTGYPSFELSDFNEDEVYDDDSFENEDSSEHEEPKNDRSNAFSKTHWGKENE